MPSIETSPKDNYIWRAQVTEEAARKRYGTYDRHGYEDVPRLPTSFASEIIEYWTHHFEEHVDVSAGGDHAEAHKAFVGLVYDGARTGSELEPWVAEDFWYEQERLAAALTKIRPFPNPDFLGHLYDKASEKVKDAAAAVTDPMKKAAAAVGESLDTALLIAGALGALYLLTRRSDD